MYVTKIGENLVRLGHVLVKIVKVGQQQLSPSVEVVESLIDAGAFCETLMQVANQFDLVACPA